MRKPRPTYSYALNSNTRVTVLKSAADALVKIAGKMLPNRFATLKNLGSRAVLTIDGSC